MATMVDDSTRKELLSFFFARCGSQMGRCLAPGLICAAPAIRAHSVQNSQVLDLLVRDGHVIAPKIRFSLASGPVFTFDDVGRNQATTFAGFCSEHDSSIFKPIDNNAFRSDSEYLFLMAYRAVARGLHAQMDAAYKIQGTYNKRVELGIDSGNEPSDAGMLAVQHMMKSYQTYVYKIPFDEALVSGKYDAVSHLVINLQHQAPTIAVCSHFALDDLSRNGDPVRVSLNILPLDIGQSVAVFSYLSSETDLVRAALHRILTSEGEYQKYLLSKLVLNNCENFVVSPSYYDQWSPEKKKAITDFFVETLYTGKLEVENQNLYLF
jgi:hypothetical protein